MRVPPGYQVPPPGTWTDEQVDKALSMAHSCYSAVRAGNADRLLSEVAPVAVKSGTEHQAGDMDRDYLICEAVHAANIAHVAGLPDELTVLESRRSLIESPPDRAVQAMRRLALPPSGSGSSQRLLLRGLPVKQSVAGVYVVLISVVLMVFMEYCVEYHMDRPVPEFPRRH